MVQRTGVAGSGREGARGGRGGGGKSGHFKSWPPVAVGSAAHLNFLLRDGGKCFVARSLLFSAWSFRYLGGIFSSLPPDGWKKRAVQQ